MSLSDHIFNEDVVDDFHDAVIPVGDVREAIKRIIEEFKKEGKIKENNNKLDWEYCIDIINDEIGEELTK